MQIKKLGQALDIQFLSSLDPSLLLALALTLTAEEASLRASLLFACAF
jgi:hypothetical protein